MIRLDTCRLPLTFPNGRKEASQRCSLLGSDPEILIIIDPLSGMPPRASASMPGFREPPNVIQPGRRVLPVLADGLSFQGSSRKICSFYKNTVVPAKVALSFSSRSVHFTWLIQHIHVDLLWEWLISRRSQLMPTMPQLRRQRRLSLKE